MNVFEDLVVELKEENLLESTVIDAPGHSEEQTDVFDDPELSAEGPSAIHETDEPPAKPAAAPANASNIANNKEFFKKKAVGEVSALQMVEHVITGVEREYLKVMPKPFDDFAAKKALNLFINSEADASSEEHATAEFNLLKETEGWCTALATRDRDIPVYSLREYCERSRPALSSQALLALGRFYRNLPYTEPVRSKFDFVITRLFSRPVGQEKRVALFTRDEMLGHINTLYSDWSSIPLYDVDEDESKVMLTALSFEDLAIEAENASNFDQLIESDFFGRLRMFKESISELFYAPQVTAAAIDCNIRIGNAYVELIDRARQKLDSDSLHSKYSEHDSDVSDVTGKTLQLSDLLKELSQDADEVPVRDDAASDVSEHAAEPARKPAGRVDKRRRTETILYNDLSFIQKVRRNAFGVSTWVIVFAMVMIAISAGLYIWSGYTSEETASTSNVSVFEVENTIFKDYVQTAKVSPPTLYAQMKPSWDNVAKDKKQEILQKLLQAAQGEGCTQVTLIGAKDSRNVGYASGSRIDIPR